MKKQSFVTKILVMLLVAGCFLFPVACKDKTSFDTSSLDSSGQSISIALSHSEVSLNIGGRIRLTATVINYEADVVFTSSNEGVATVNRQGLVEAVSSGTAEITATAGTVSAKCVVQIATGGQKLDDVPVLTLLTGTDTVYVGYEFPLCAKLVFQGVEVDNVMFDYYVSNADRAEIVDNNFKAKTAGKVEVVAYCEYNGEIFFDSCVLQILEEFATIQVTNPVGDEISARINDSGVITYILSINGESAADVNNVTISSSNENIVKITNNSYQCLAVGKAEVVLSYKGSPLKTIIFIIE